jgi:signal transduction histidine kinase
MTEIYLSRGKIQENEAKIREQFEKLKETDRLKEEFTTMITHELKTPLVTIYGYAQMLKEKGFLGDFSKEQLDAVDQINFQSEKLEKIISDIFDAQKLDLGSMKFKRESFKVDEFMNEIINQNKFLMSDKKIDFINSTKEKFDLASDKDRLAQVFSNLIKNSVDFVPESGGSIDINAQIKDSQAVFYVKDNGIGIPFEKQENLFKKFYQIDTTLKRKHGGTGLGLVICKGIVEALGGKIWLESKVGKSTIVYFSIPINANKQES